MDAPFKSLSEAMAAYAQLEETSNALVAEHAEKVDSLNADIAAKQTALDALAADKDELTAQLDAAKSAETALTAEVEKLQADAKTVEQRAAEMVAATGTDPIAGANPAIAQANLKNRAEFEKLSLSERVKFFKDGGIVTTD